MTQSSPFASCVRRAGAASSRGSVRLVARYSRGSVLVRRAISLPRSGFRDILRFPMVSEWSTTFESDGRLLSVFLYPGPCRDQGSS